jgi:large-conductance mechanosensitive channel
MRLDIKSKPMINIFRNMLAIIAGVVIGSAVNMALITISPSLIPPPAGVDVTDAESLAKSIHLFEAKHFLMPFLAHALGTLVGAIIAYLIAASYKTRIAYVIGIVFLCGGIAASFMIPAPLWFIALDILVAYIPMAWLGIQICARLLQQKHV